jgi:hypothetical protein
VAELRRSVLGAVEQDQPGGGHREAAQRRRARADRNRQVEREPGLAALCRVPDYAARGAVVAVASRSGGRFELFDAA